MRGTQFMHEIRTRVKKPGGNKMKPTLITKDGLYELLKDGDLYKKYGKTMIAYTDLSSESSGAMSTKKFNNSYTLMEGVYDLGNQVYLLK